MIHAAIQKVELVGGESWWSHNLGSLLIGLAAIFAAGLAAYISVRNHKQQLSHDREIRDRDATRKAIDRAVRGISDFVLQGVTLSGLINGLEMARRTEEEGNSTDENAAADRRRQLEEADAAIRQTVQSVSAATNTVHADTIHLSIRLGKTHPVTATQMRTRDALKAWVLALDKGTTHNRNAEELEAAGKRQKQFGSARADFESACFAWLNEDD